MGFAPSRPIPWSITKSPTSINPIASAGSPGTTLIWVSPGRQSPTGKHYHQETNRCHGWRHCQRIFETAEKRGEYARFGDGRGGIYRLRAGQISGARTGPPGVDGRQFELCRKFGIARMPRPNPRAPISEYRHLRPRRHGPGPEPVQARQGDASGGPKPCRPLDCQRRQLCEHQYCRHFHGTGGGARLLGSAASGGPGELSFPSRFDRRGLWVAGATRAVLRDHALRSKLALFRHQSGLGPSSQGLGAHLRAAGAGRPLFKHLRPAPVSRKADTADHSQRAGRPARAGLRPGRQHSRLAVCRRHCPGA